MWILSQRITVLIQLLNQAEYDKCVKVSCTLQTLKLRCIDRRLNGNKPCWRHPDMSSSSRNWNKIIKKRDESKKVEKKREKNCKRWGVSKKWTYQCRFKEREVFFCLSLVSSHTYARTRAHTRKNIPSFYLLCFRHNVFNLSRNQESETIFFLSFSCFYLSSASDNRIQHLSTLSASLL